ncbi:hypothetical protein DIPPA_35655 [Diplonema papillatum]|nr:hypothetical protein DIPPA_35655 [Diplonema papillatum]
MARVSRVVLRSVATGLCGAGCGYALQGTCAASAANPEPSAPPLEEMERVGNNLRNDVQDFVGAYLRTQAGQQIIRSIVEGAAREAITDSFVQVSGRVSEEMRAEVLRARSDLMTASRNISAGLAQQVEDAAGEAVERKARQMINEDVGVQRVIRKHRLEVEGSMRRAADTVLATAVSESQVLRAIEQQVAAKIKSDLQTEVWGLRLLSFSCVAAVLFVHFQR